MSVDGVQLGVARLLRSVARLLRSVARRAGADGDGGAAAAVADFADIGLGTAVSGVLLMPPV